jgi:hypothetical protein
VKENRYDTVYDLQVKVVTNFIILVIAVALAANFFSSPAEMRLSRALLVVLVPVVLVTWGIHPLHYRISDSSIKIRRPFNTIDIPFETITDLRLIKGNELGFLIRMFGSGGLFGYLGTFRSPAIGKFMMWCTNKDDLILIITHEKKIAISPSNAEAFLSDYAARTS